jgi:TetR/AcrR family transcriptional regulator, mexCD-oprJ operon repressor
MAPRADARKNVEAIVNAAAGCLAVNPNATINEVAEAAGVGRMTVYGHFPTRSALVAEVAERAVQRTNAELEPLSLAGDPRCALERLLRASWRITFRTGALIVAAEQTLTAQEIHDVHDDLNQRYTQLLERGRNQGQFCVDLPLGWQLTMITCTLHGAVAAVHRGEIEVDEAPELVVRTVLNIVRVPEADR